MWAQQPESAPRPRELPAFLPHACRQLQASFCVRVAVETQEEYVSKIEEKSKKSGKAKSVAAMHSSRTHHDSPEDDDESDQPTGAFEDSDEILITIMHDAFGRAVEIIFNRCREVPRLLFKIIGLCIPYHPWISKLTVRWSPLAGVVLYEIAKFLTVSQLTEICLDDSPVPESNYHMILEHGQLRRLSLARCNLDDQDCATIASKLRHPLPTSRNLVALSLVSNTISDVGACALGLMLRSNRTLLYLNLSGNRISDVGAASLFRSLTEFHLTYEELTTKRQRLIEYLQLKREVYTKCLNELMTSLTERTPVDDTGRSGRRKTVAKVARKTSITAGTTSLGVGSGGLDAVPLKADAMADELVGSYSDPFSLEETVSRDSYIYSVGNTALCYLSLAYNNLGFASVVGLLEVLRYQSVLANKSGSALLRVLIEGNRIPVECYEYTAIQELLDKAIAAKMAKTVRRNDRMSQGRFKSK